MLTSSSVTMLVTMTVFMVLSGLSVIVRIILRRQQHAGLKADDYFVMAAYTFSTALAITNIVGVPVGGFGVPFLSLNDAKAAIFLKIDFVMQFWYIIAVALVKLSILCFYGRVFGVGQFPTSVRILLGISTAWLVSFLLATFFQAWPISCNWKNCVPIMDYPVMYILSSTTDIVIDISILCLPAFFIHKLHLNGNQKIGIGAIFGLGIFCVVSSVARLAYTIMFNQTYLEASLAVNFDTAAVNIIMWSGIEACASTICANLPCYGPLLRRVRSVDSIIANLRSLLSIRSTPSKGKSTHRPSASTENIFWLEPAVMNHIEGGNPRVASSGVGQDLELAAIRVHNSVDIDSRSR